MAPEQLFEPPQESREGPPIVRVENGGSVAMTRVERVIDQRMASIPVEVSQAIGVRVRAALEAVQDRTTGALDGVRSAVAGVEERVTGHLDALSRSVNELPEGVKGSVEAALASIRADLETMHALPKNIARVLQVVREAMTSIADSQEILGGRVAALESGFDERMTRVDELAGAIESLGKRRGFRDLVRSERETVEQQEAYVQRLVELGQELGERLSDVERAMRESNIAPELRKVRSDLGSALGDLRDRMAAELASGFAGIQGAADGSEADAEVIKELRAARSELDRIRTRMDSWGRSRSAPRLAQEVSDLGERVEEVERVVQEGLTDAVYARMEEHLDRRFEALVRLIESRVSSLIPPDDEEPRTRRRRR